MNATLRTLVGLATVALLVTAVFVPGRRADRPRPWLGRTVAGRVVDADGRPLGDVEVVSRDGEDTPGRTDADGRFVVRRRSAGDGIVLDLRPADAAHAELHVTSFARATDVGTLMLAPSRSVSGRFELSDGMPVRSAAVRLVLPCRDDPVGLAPRRTFEVTTDDQGRFTAVGLSALSYDVTGIADGLPWTRYELRADDDGPLVLRAVPTRELRVRVVDDDGAPVGGTVVRAIGHEPFSITHGTTAGDGVVMLRVR